MIFILVKQKYIPSNYDTLYELIIPKDNLLRKIKEMIDFSFIYDELNSKYCINNGRVAINPIRMFKYLLLKIIFDISDVDVVERSRYDMSFKYFLDMTPEEDVINSSSLTKFRKLRLKDSHLLDVLINKTVEIAIEHNLIKCKTLIVDSTHTKSRYNQKTPREILVDRSKNLRKSIYKIDEKMKSKFPPKANNGILEDQIQYCQKLIEVIESNKIISNVPSVKERINLLKESIEDDLDELYLSNDCDAKVGHKTADTSYFGYKTHLAMTEERIITAAVVTSGEKHDGKQLKELIEKSVATGMNIQNIVGDMAYSEKDNLDYADEKELNLISKLSKTITHGNSRVNKSKFEYNKDADMYVCETGHMAIKKTSTRPKKHAIDGNGTVESYFFDVEKCKLCSKKDGCYKDGAKTKSYSVSIMSNTHKEQIEFQETEYFKEKSKERYKIEAKNSELKHRHGYDVASSSGLSGMQLQCALSIVTVNLKRIIKLMN